MSKEPRYTLCTIVTKDVNLVVDCDDIRKTGMTYEDIIRAGVNAIKSTK